MTNREKYEQFRRLYPGSDLVWREDHRRFDRLVRLLLDLPERDEEPVPEIEAGDFVRQISAGLVSNAPVIRVEQVALEDIGCGLVWWLCGVDALGRPTRWPAKDCAVITAWRGEPERPF